jgi:fibronectin type 3 domain-containing protein
MNEQGAEYEIFHSYYLSSNFSKIATVPYTESSYEDTNVKLPKPGGMAGHQPHYYKIKAVDNRGLKSDYSNTKSIIGAGDLIYKKGSEALPEVYAISQNYPNPFNPTTSIKYQLPKNSFVTISIYDMLGREVANLVNEEQEAGYYEFSFDGSQLSSGTYIYKITAGDFTDSKKLLLVK